MTQYKTTFKPKLDIAGGWDFSIVVTKQGRVFSTGSNSFCQLGTQNIKIRKMRYFLKKIHLIQSYKSLKIVCKFVAKLLTYGIQFKVVLTF